MSTKERKLINRPRKCRLLNGSRAFYNTPFVKPMRYCCRICKSTHRKKSTFLQHLKVHMGTPLSCNLCKELFNNRPAYEFHNCAGLQRDFKRLFAKVNRQKFYRCEQCKKTFLYIRHYKQHLEGHKRNNCDHCNTILTRRSELVKHMLEEHNITLSSAKHKCHICNKSYVKKRSLFCHLRLHVEKEGKQICIKCGVISESLESYQKHLLKHENTQKFRCAKCGEGFSRNQQYKLHLLRHNAYSCTICDQSFASRLKASNHLKETGHYLPGLQLKKQCKVCDKVFTKRYSLTRHIKKRHPNYQLNILANEKIDETFYCEPCKKSFDSKHQYESHIKTVQHQKNTPGMLQLICETCGKQFNKKYLLEQHVKIVHLKTQSILICEFCDYQTTYITNFERHRELHLATTKDYMCEQCGKGFQSIAGLRDHTQYNHVQERKFKCPDCPKAFKRNSELVRHSKTHSNDSPYICNICNFTFKRTSHLKRHQLLVHKIDSKTRKVQRINADPNVDLVSTLTELQNKQPIDIHNDFNMQHVDYFNIPGIPDNLTAQNAIADASLQELTKGDMSMEYVQSVYWSDRVNLDKTDVGYMKNEMYQDPGILPQMNMNSGSDLQALNIVDQLVNTFLPDKGLQDVLYEEYTDQSLQYTGMLPGSVGSSDLITSTDKILQGHCDQNSILGQMPDDYMHTYQYMP